MIFRIKRLQRMDDTNINTGIKYDKESYYKHMNNYINNVRHVGLLNNGTNNYMTVNNNIIGDILHVEDDYMDVDIYSYYAKSFNPDKYRVMVCLECDTVDDCHIIYKVKNVLIASISELFYNTIIELYGSDSSTDIKLCKAYFDYYDNNISSNLKDIILDRTNETDIAIAINKIINETGDENNE
ncbi:MAG: hypothetical protein ACRCXT_16275 [Paraclostridium sp.]